MHISPRKLDGFGCGKWGKSDPVIILARCSRGPGERSLFYDEYHVPVWPLLLYQFPQKVAGVCESLSAQIVL